MNVRETNASSPLDLDQLRWFVCRANRQRMTHSLRQTLDHLGIEYYMALHAVLRKQGQIMLEEEESWLGSIFFVRTTLRHALKLKFDNGLDYQYERDGHKQLLWVPDMQLQDFRTVIEKMAEKVDFNANVFAVGDPVIVTRGPLCGVHGTLIDIGERKMQLLLKVPGIIAISISIAKSNVRKVADPVL